MIKNWLRKRILCNVELRPLYVISFGCQMNMADSAEMASAFKERGFEPTPELNNADVAIINTCTVRQHAEDRAFSFVGRLREWKEENPKRTLIVAGCAAERTKDTLRKRFPFVDFIVGTKSIEEFPRFIDEILKEKSPSSLIPSYPHTLIPSSFVTIMRGCNYSCSYCIVPFVRGRESYRSPEAILREVEEKTKAGIQEITLLGQTVNSYRHEEWSFSKLLRAVARVQDLKRLRFMSPHPYYVSKELVETMAALPKMARHIHLPLQSGSNRILSLMKRNYTREKYLEIIKSLRSRIPDIAITTDIIVGFPTETEEDFKETLDLIETIGFDSAFYFKYSPRQGTDAAQFPEQAPQILKEERLRQVREVADKKARQQAENYQDKICDVLFESETEGRTSTNYRVKINEQCQSDKVTGKILAVEITHVKNRKLYGRLLEKNDTVTQ